MAEYVIKADSLTKKFGDFTAVNAITFEVGKGEVFGFLGANGAGKTTAMRMLCGLLKPTSGDATIAGFDIYRQTEQIKKNIGYMSQKFSLYEDLSVLENIRFFGGIYGLDKQQLKDRTGQLLHDLGLELEAKKLVSEMPLGWKQKLSFSVAVLHSPAIVFLDEPTGGVDPVARRQFWDMIYEAADRGVTIFVTTHYMDEAEILCDRIAIMDNGKIVAIDTPKNLIKQLLARGFKKKQVVEQANLEDVFIDLTGKDLRES